MFKYFEKGLNFSSGIITTFQFLVSVVNTPNNIDTYTNISFIKSASEILSVLSGFIKTSPPYGKFFMFIVLEIANAYFFAFLFKNIRKSNNSIAANILFYIFVIISTVFISVIFLNTVIFTFTKSLPIFSILFTVSMLITMTFFFCETYYETGQQTNNFIDRYLTRVDLLRRQPSLWFLMLTYFSFWILFAYEMYKP